MDVNDAPSVVYHYTVGLKLRAIARDGYLKLTPTEPKLGEKAVVWLSTEPLYEATATKMMMDINSERPRLSTMEEMDARMGGIYRFCFEPNAFPPDTVLPWAVLKHRARMPKKLTKRLVERAKRVKARPSRWYGTLNELPVEHATLQVLDLSNKQWQTVSLEQELSKPMPYDTVRQVADFEMPKEFRARDDDWV